MLPVSFLRQLIQFYGDSFQSMLPAYLEMSMQGFAQQHEKWREYMHTTLGDKEKAEAFDAQVRKNMEMFEETMRFFTPYPAQQAPKPDAAKDKERLRRPPTPSSRCSSRCSTCSSSSPTSPWAVRPGR